MALRSLVWGDSGLRDGAANLRLDREQLARTRASGATLLRFHSCTPTASLGAHEDEAHSLRAGYCADSGLPVVRRLSGGSALYLDAGQLCWTLTTPSPRPDFGAWFARLGDALCAALGEAGCPARFRAPNDIEFDGRKLGSLFIGAEDGVLLAQGTLFAELDVETMLKVLRVPKEKLTPEGFHAATGHFASLAEAAPDAGRRGLQERIAARLAQTLPSAGPEKAPWFSAADPASASGPAAAEPEYPYSAFLKTPGGVLVGHLRLDPRGRVEAVRLRGNLHVWPNGLFGALEDRLRGASQAELGDRLAEFFRHTPHVLHRFGEADVRTLLARLFERRHQARSFGLSKEAVNTIMVHDPEGSHTAFAILEKTQAVLVPYCAKPQWCKWRHRDGCSKCGLCAVGEAYRLAEERGLEVTTIRNFEHLEETLGVLGEAGVSSYLGMCCSNFFIKRERAFRRAGIPAVLLDISGSNCYELGQEQMAYAGTFKAEAELNLPVVESVMRFVPHRKTPNAPPAAAPLS